MFKVRIIGATRLQQNANRLSRRMSGEMMQRGFLRGLDKMNDIAASLAPVGVSTDRSDLANSMVTETIDVTPNTVEMAAGPDNFRGFAGFWQETGTVHHGKQPFLGPAFNSQQDRIIREVAIEIEREILADVVRN